MSERAEPLDELIREAASDLPLRDFEGTLARLADPDAEHRPGELRMLSDADADEQRHFRERLESLEAEQRHRLTRWLVDFGEVDVQGDFRPLMWILLDDADERVRALAIQGLWESRELGLIERLAGMLERDPVDRVRARAAEALGRFVELGELRVHLRDRLAPVVEGLLERAADPREHPEVRRRALASAGYSEHPDLPGIIEQSLEEDAIEVRAGALRAMGNSADDRWSEAILDWLEEPEPELRFEAVRAAGELAIEAALSPLITLAQYETDRAIRGEAVWALGEIGGKDARRALEAVGADVAGIDEDLAEAVEDALSSCALIEGELSFARLDEPDDDAADPDGWAAFEDQGDVEEPDD